MNKKPQLLASYAGVLSAGASPASDPGAGNSASGRAGVDSRAPAPNLEALSEHFHVYAPEQRGHGHTPDVGGPITFELMAQDTIAFIETVIGRPVYLFGSSDGAILALTVAIRRPDLVRRLVFAAGVFHRDGWEAGVLDGEPPDFLTQS